MSLDQAILHLIEKHPIPDQSTLLSMLEKLDIKATQATISRRLAKLAVQKRNGHYQRIIPTNHPLPPYTLEESPPNLIVLQTGPNDGMTLAVRVDRSKVPGIAGTLAGNDTLFIAIKRGCSIEHVRRELESILGPPVDSH